MFLLALFGFLPAGYGQDAVFPVACQPGLSCFILSYPDIDKQEGVAKDFACGGLAGDGDVFLRIGMSSIEALRNPVDVLATRAGVVTDVQDNAKDLLILHRHQLMQGDSLCGNGVVIDHGGGIQSAYCHLRMGSVKVKKGQRVEAGEVIGAVGQSGFATWPQLGFSMRAGGMMIDPITSMTDIEGCGFKPHPAIPLPPAFAQYNPAAIVAVGFSEDEHSLGSMLRGAAQHQGMMDSEAESLTFWATIIGVRRGDEINITLFDARGRPFETQEIIAAADEAHTPINVTRKRGYARWRKGVYTGRISLTRTLNAQPYTVVREAQLVVN